MNIAKLLDLDPCDMWLMDHIKIIATGWDNMMGISVLFKRRNKWYDANDSDESDGEYDYLPKCYFYGMS